MGRADHPVTLAQTPRILPVHPLGPVWPPAVHLTDHAYTLTSSTSGMHRAGRYARVRVNHSGTEVVDQLFESAHAWPEQVLISVEEVYRVMRDPGPAQTRTVSRPVSMLDSLASGHYGDGTVLSLRLAESGHDAASAAPEERDDVQDRGTTHQQR